jgi:O-methyltransferase
MNTSIRLARFFKKVFIFGKLHIIFSPFENIFRNAAYLSRLSKFAHKHKGAIKYNDFPSRQFDYGKREGLYQFLLDNYIQNVDIQYLEFGVCGGDSFKWWVNNHKNANSSFHGFDTFEGLPEDWGPFKKGDMGTNAQAPDIKDSRVHFYKGLFQQTLPTFTKQVSTTTKKVIHMDADLYSSTLYTLTSLAPYLQKGDIILFDEFLVPTHEFLAYDEFVKSYYINLELIAAANNYYFTAFKVN